MISEAMPQKQCDDGGFDWSRFRAACFACRADAAPVDQALEALYDLQQFLLVQPEVRAAGAAIEVRFVELPEVLRVVFGPRGYVSPPAQSSQRGAGGNNTPLVVELRRFADAVLALRCWRVREESLDVLRGSGPTIDPPPAARTMYGPRKQVAVVCGHCGVTFAREASYAAWRAKLGQKTFCSQDCQRAGKRRTLPN